MPKHPRTEADENRVQAEALLATARTMEQRQDSAAALRLYERAFRLDPHAVAALEEIVPLAFSLNRRDESLRYAVKLAEQDTSDPDLPRRIGMYLAENGNWKPAIKLLQRSVKVMETGRQAGRRAARGRGRIGPARFPRRRNMPTPPRCSTKSPPRWPSQRISASTKRPGERSIGDGGLTYELMGDAYLEVGRTGRRRESVPKPQRSRAEARRCWR